MESISAATKDVLLSADVGGFWFDESDDGGDGFYEFSEGQLVAIAFRSKGNMPHFRKPVFIGPTVIDSYSSFEKFCGNDYAAVDWFLPLSVASFRFWVILLQYAFNESNMTIFDSVFEKQ